MTVLGPQVIQTVKNDKLDIIVGLLDDEGDEARGSSYIRDVRPAALGRFEPYEPLTAAGFCVRVVRVVAASYFTACDEAFRSSKMTRMYRD